MRGIRSSELMAGVAGCAGGALRIKCAAWRDWWSAKAERMVALRACDVSVVVSWRACLDISFRTRRTWRLVRASPCNVPHKTAIFVLRHRIAHRRARARRQRMRAYPASVACAPSRIFAFCLFYIMKGAGTQTTASRLSIDISTPLT